MRKPEQKAYDLFKRHSNKCGGLKIYRVENIFGNGMPDVHGINDFGWVFWIENKACAALPVRPCTPVLRPLMRPGQDTWGADWNRRNGNSFILLKAGRLIFFVRTTLEIIDAGKEELADKSIARDIRSVIKYLSEMRNEQ